MRLPSVKHVLLRKKLARFHHFAGRCPALSGELDKQSSAPDGKSSTDATPLWRTGDDRRRSIRSVIWGSLQKPFPEPYFRFCRARLSRWGEKLKRQFASLAVQRTSTKNGAPLKRLLASADTGLVPRELAWNLDGTWGWRAGGPGAFKSAEGLWNSPRTAKGLEGAVRGLMIFSTRLTATRSGRTSYSWVHGLVRAKGFSHPNRKKSCSGVHSASDLPRSPNIQ